MMEFRIADTFTDSLAKLTGEEQKAVKTTAFDLQMNPAHPGMQLHKIDRAKDPNFWCIRVSRDIRLIIHRTERSLLLCYVNHHVFRGGAQGLLGGKQGVDFFGLAAWVFCLYIGCCSNVQVGGLAMTFYGEVNMCGKVSHRLCLLNKRQNHSAMVIWVPLEFATYGRLLDVKMGIGWEGGWRVLETFESLLSRESVELLGDRNRESRVARS